MKIKDLPPKIKEIALKRQQEQGNPADENQQLGCVREYGGFNWDEAPEGRFYWQEVNRKYKPEPETTPHMSGNMVKIISGFVLAILGGLFLYLIFAFAEMELNVGEWNVGTRVLLSVFFTVFCWKCFEIVHRELKGDS